MEISGSTSGLRPLPPAGGPLPSVSAGPFDTFASVADPPGFDLSQAAKILNGTRLTPDGRAVMLWNLDTGHYRSRVHTAPGVLFESGMDGTVRGLSSDGRISWEKKIAGTTEPAASRDGLLFVSTRKKIVALDESGHEAWSVSPSSSLSSACAAGPEGNCYVADNGRLLALDGRTGATLWKFEQRPAHEDRPPSVGPDGTVYYCSGGDVLHAIAPDGTEKWRYDAFEKKRRPLFSDFKTRLAVTPDGCVAFGASDGKLHLVGARGEVWARELPSPPTEDGSPDVDSDGRIYIGSGTQVLAFDVADGTPCWSQDVGPVEQLTALSQGVAVNVRGIGLHGLDAAGNGRWSVPTGDDARAKPVVGPHGEIFVGAEQGLIALSPIDRYTATPAGPAAPAPTIVAQEEWIVIGGVKVPVRKP